MKNTESFDSYFLNIKKDKNEKKSCNFEKKEYNEIVKKISNLKLRRKRTWDVLHCQEIYITEKALWKN